MLSKRPRLTAPLRQHIVAGVRAGGYPSVVAQAWGVPSDVFQEWLQRGLASHGREPYVSFSAEVREAQAQARLRAEAAVFADEPRIWLEHGPGRETPTQPGWSSPVKAAEVHPEEANILARPDIVRLLARVLEMLLPFPDARQHVAQGLWETGTSPQAAKRKAA